MENIVLQIIAKYSGIFPLELRFRELADGNKASILIYREYLELYANSCSLQVGNIWNKASILIYRELADWNKGRSVSRIAIPSALFRQFHATPLLLTSVRVLQVLQLLLWFTWYTMVIFVLLIVMPALAIGKP
ncbi:hypothetical protein RJT34_09680 [Clitoria ternatea]|uniref:Uncharacterized protein n=1 Tax=Clitoria ternatea TaxID=43366 RepID=A0AAN9PWI2_CLITE